jgi:hypothetical protein
MPAFSPQDILARRAKRLAELLRDHWEEGSGFDTRFFEPPFIHDYLVMRGRSVEGGGYREHIVPRVVIRDGCLRMLETRATTDDLQQAIIAHLGIVEITREEARHLDFDLKLKTTMPPGWRFGVDDPFARIKAAQIAIASNTGFVTQAVEPLNEC